MQQKISYAPRSPLQKLLMPFYDRTTLIFGLSEQDSVILNLCARSRSPSQSQSRSQLRFQSRSRFQSDPGPVPVPFPRSRSRSRSQSQSSPVPDSGPNLGLVSRPILVLLPFRSPRSPDFLNSRSNFVSGSVSSYRSLRFPNLTLELQFCNFSIKCNIFSSCSRYLLK